MKKKKVTVLLLVAVTAISLLSACGKQNGGGDLPPVNKGMDSSISFEGNNQEDNQENNQQTVNQEQKGGNENFDGQADLEGSVYDFTEMGFSLSPAETYDTGDGFVMAQAAPGAEDTSKLVTITYAEDCNFQIVVMDLSSLKEVSREDTTSESIKKQTQVKVYGNCQDTTHWTAENIIIVRWQ